MNGDKKLIPLIFSHGLAGQRTAYSGLCKDLASHGYLVIAPSHFDGTAQICKKKDGTTKFWTSEQPHNSIEFRRENLAQRVSEIQNIVDDIFEAKFCSETLGFGNSVDLDLESLIMSGHSFGGMTAIQTAHDEPRVKYLAAWDPWLWCVHEDV